MDSIQNPFSPGAGSPPSDLVGRDQVLRQAQILFGRVEHGKSEKSLLLTGLRGVGKTGSSRNFMGRGEKIESAAVEEDSGAVVEGVTEATGIGLEGLDFGVEALGHETSVKTMHIDWLVGTGAAKKINFIKMDIEGAELHALKGAEQTIKKFRPKLAITVYHHFQDFWTIPQYIDSLALGYRFEMRHFTIHAEETLIYAKVN